MINLINFKLILNTSFHPAIPLFFGALNNRSITKWRGAAAEFTYNSYLRNGWVVVDTGIKGGSGTPIIEFSTWQAAKSRVNISLPNTISYKFFMADYDWRAGYIARSSVEANENWIISDVSSPALLNSYSSWRTPTRKINSFLYLSVFQGLLTYQNLLSSRLATQFFARTDEIFRKLDNNLSLDLTRLTSNIRLNLKFNKSVQNYKRDFARFYAFDKHAITVFYDSYLPAGVSFFYRTFFGFFRRNLLDSIKSSNDWAHPQQNFLTFFKTNEFSSFSDILFRLNVLVVAYSYIKNDISLRAIFDKFISLTVKRLTTVVFLSSSSTNFINLKSFKEVSLFLISRVKLVLISSNLSPFNVARLIIFFLTRYVKAFIKISLFREKLQTKLKFVSSAASYIFKKLRTNSFFFKQLSNGNKHLNSTLSADSFNNFFKNYLRIRTKRSFFNFKFKTSRKRRKYAFVVKSKIKRPVVAKKVKWYYRSWSRLTSFFKLFFLRKQFFFISFWTFNFFNLSFVPSVGKNKRVFLRTVRLVHFFKKFFNFFKFYSFYFNLMQLLMSAIAKPRKNSPFYRQYLNNLSAFLWILHVKFWRVLRAFASLTRKFFLLRWKKITGQLLRPFPKRLTHPTYLKYRGLAQLKKRNKLLSVRGGRRTLAPSYAISLAKSYIGFIKHQRGVVSATKSIFSRRYLQFLLTLRRRSIRLAARSYIAKFSASLKLPLPEPELNGLRSIKIALIKRLRPVFFSLNKGFHKLFESSILSVFNVASTLDPLFTKAFSTLFVSLASLLENMRIYRGFKTNYVRLKKSLRFFLRKILALIIWVSKKERLTLETRALLKLIWVSVTGFALVIRVKSFFKKTFNLIAFLKGSTDLTPDFKDLSALSSLLFTTVPTGLRNSALRPTAHYKTLPIKRTLLLVKHALRFRNAPKTLPDVKLVSNKDVSLGFFLNNMRTYSFFHRFAALGLSFTPVNVRTNFNYGTALAPSDSIFFFNKLNSLKSLTPANTLLFFYRVTNYSTQVRPVFFSSILSFVSSIYSIFSKTKLNLYGSGVAAFSTFSSTYVALDYTVFWYLSKKLVLSRLLSQNYAALSAGFYSFVSKLASTTLKFKRKGSSLLDLSRFTSKNSFLQQKRVFSSFFLKKLALGAYCKLNQPKTPSFVLRNLSFPSLPVSKVTPFVFEQTNSSIFYRSSRVTYYFKKYFKWLMFSLMVSRHKGLLREKKFWRIALNRKKLRGFNSKANFNKIKSTRFSLKTKPNKIKPNRFISKTKSNKTKPNRFNSKTKSNKTKLSGVEYVQKVYRRKLRNVRIFRNKIRLFKNRYLRKSRKTKLIVTKFKYTKIPYRYVFKTRNSKFLKKLRMRKRRNAKLLYRKVAFNVKHLTTKLQPFATIFARKTSKVLKGSRISRIRRRYANTTVSVYNERYFLATKAKRPNRLLKVRELGSKFFTNRLRGWLKIIRKKKFNVTRLFSKTGLVDEVSKFLNLIDRLKSFELSVHTNKMFKKGCSRFSAIRAYRRKLFKPIIGANFNLRSCVLLSKRLNSIRANAVFGTSLDLAKSINLSRVKAFFKFISKLNSVCKNNRRNPIPTRQTTASHTAVFSVLAYKKYFISFLRCLALTLRGIRGMKGVKYFNSQSSLFDLVRSAPKLLLEATARRLGILKKKERNFRFNKTKRWRRNRNYRRKSYWLPNYVRFKSKKTDWVRGNKSKGFMKRKYNHYTKKPSQIPSVFNKSNSNSMQLSWDFKDSKFRFLRIKKFFALKRKTKFFFKGTMKRVARLYKAWKKKRKRTLLRRWRKSKTLRFIKKARKFYLKKLMLFRLRFTSARLFIRAFFKLIFLKKYAPFVQNRRTLRLTKKIALHVKKRTVSPYTSLYALIAQKVLFRAYAFYSKQKNVVKLNLFKTLKFSFIFKFVSIFFKKSFLFFSNFVVFAKLAFFSGKNFIFFANNFSFATLSNNVNTVFDLTSSNYLGLGLVFKQNTFIGLNTKCIFACPSAPRANFFYLTGFLRANFYSISEQTVDYLRFTFELSPSLRMWARVSKSFLFSGKLKRTLIISRIAGYHKPRRQTNKNVLKKRLVRFDRKIKHRLFFKKVLNASSRMVFKEKMKVLPKSLFFSLNRLRKAKAKNKLKLISPLVGYLRLALAKRWNKKHNWRIRSYTAMIKKAYSNIRYSPLNKPLNFLSKNANDLIFKQIRGKRLIAAARVLRQDKREPVLKKLSAYKHKNSFQRNLWATLMRGSATQLTKRAVANVLLKKNAALRVRIKDALLSLKQQKPISLKSIKLTPVSKKMLKILGNHPLYTRSPNKGLPTSNHIINRLGLRSFARSHVYKYSRFRRVNAVGRKRLRVTLAAQALSLGNAFPGPRWFRWRF